MHWSRALMLGWLAVTLSACAGPNDTAGPVVIAAAAPVYPEGAVVTVTVTNLSSERLQYSPCFPRLEQQAVGGAWNTVHEDGSPCPAVLELLDGFRSRQAGVTLPSDLPSGTYRVRFPMIGKVQSGEPLVVAAQIGGTLVVQ